MKNYAKFEAHMSPLTFLGLQGQLQICVSTSSLVIILKEISKQNIPTRSWSNISKYIVTTNKTIGLSCQQSLYTTMLSVSSILLPVSSYSLPVKVTIQTFQYILIIIQPSLKFVTVCDFAINLDELQSTLNNNIKKLLIHTDFQPWTSKSKSFL